MTPHLNDEPFGAHARRRARARESRLSDWPFVPQPPAGRPARYLRAAVVCFLLALGVAFALANYWSGSL